MAEFLHIGVPCRAKPADSVYVAEAKVSVTNPDAHPLHFEYCVADADSPLPEVLSRLPHVAFGVADIDAALEGEEVIYGPQTVMNGGARIAFILRDGVPIEFIQSL